jgi:hypothetical protein
MSHPKHIATLCLFECEDSPSAGPLRYMATFQTVDNGCAVAGNERAESLEALLELIQRRHLALLVARVK